MTEIYSIGYGQETVDDFITRLRDNGVGKVIDVRSVPYSRDESFRRDNLIDILGKAGIEYEFRGAELGGRPDDKSFYREDGHLDYGPYGASQPVQRALKEVLTEAADGRRRRAALMCSEMKPEKCHRALMIGQEAWRQGVDMRHILADGSYEMHSALVSRILGDSLFAEDSVKHTFVSPTVIECPDKSFTITAHASETQMDGGVVYESVNPDYTTRTKENAQWADLTVALAVNFNSPGEVLTKNVAGDKYMGILLPLFDADYSSTYLAEVIASRIAAKLGEGEHKINFAGNSIASFDEVGIDQAMVDTLMTNIFSRLQAHGVRMEVRSGGQSGVDEAAITAARATGYSWSVVCPKGFRYRDGKEHGWVYPKTGKQYVNLDVVDKDAFLARFAAERLVPSAYEQPVTLEAFYALHKGEKYQTLDRAYNAKSEPHGGFRVVRYTQQQDGAAQVRYSYADAAGRLLSDFIFDEARDFCNGAARVHTSEGYNFITPAGSMMFNNPKSELGQFTRDGFAVIRMDEGYYNFVDRGGFLLNDERYEKVHDFVHGEARVVRNGKEYRVAAPWRERKPSQSKGNIIKR